MDDELPPMPNLADLLGLSASAPVVINVGRGRSPQVNVSNGKAKARPHFVDIAVGRPKKRLRDSSSEPDEDNTARLDDGDDPDWDDDDESPKPRVARKVIKRVPGPYRLKQPTRFDLEASTTTRTLAKSLKSRELTLREIVKLLQVPAENEFLTTAKELRVRIPWPDDRPLPHPSSRAVLQGIEKLDAYQKTSGGFQRYFRALSQSTLSYMITYIQRYWTLDSSGWESKASLTARLCWNLLSNDVRLQWERLERREAIEAKRAKILVSYKNDDGTMEHSGRREPVIMPLSERPFIKGGISNLLPDQVAFKCGTCSHDPEPMFTFTNVVLHYMTYHSTAQVCACHFCGHVFQSRTHLSSHDCAQFQNFVLSNFMEGISTLLMKFCMVFLACADCGLCLPLRVDFDTSGIISDYEPQWRHFINVMSKHNCGAMVPLVIHFPGKPDDSLTELTLSVVPRMLLDEVMVGCDSCGIDVFSDPAASEDHFRRFHPENQYTCGVCETTFGTKAFYKEHCLSHYPKSIILADYLAHQCRLLPPTYSSQPAGEKEIPYGGFPKVIGGAKMPLAGPFESTTHRKLLLEESLRRGGAKLNEDEVDSDPVYSPDSTSSSESASDSDGEGFNRAPRKKAKTQKAKKFSTTECYSHIQRKPIREVLKSQERWVGQLKDAEIKAALKEPGAFLAGASIVTEQCSQGTLQFSKPGPFEVHGYASSYLNHFKRVFTLPITGNFSESDTSMLFEGIVHEEKLFSCQCGMICLESETKQHVFHYHKSRPDEKFDAAMCDKMACIHAPYFPMDSKYHCVQADCVESFCGITGLRKHLLEKHLLCQPFTQTGGISVRNKRAFSLPYKTAVEKRIDQAFGMDAAGLIPRRIAGAVPMTPTSHPVYSPRQTVLPSRTTPALHSLRQGNTAPVIRQPYDGHGELTPFQMIGSDGKNNVFICNICQVNCSTGPVSHFQQFHSHLCGCAEVYQNEQALTQHRITCSSVQALGKFTRAKCPLCSYIDGIKMILRHVLMAHFNSVTFNRHTGRMSPRIHHVFQAIAPKLPEANNHKASPQSLPVKVIEIDGEEPLVVERPTFIPQGNAPHDLACFLCERLFDNIEQLEWHYQNHPETWSNCPMCFVTGEIVTIGSLLDMKQHIEERHVKRSFDGRPTCAHCQKTLGSRLYSHVIYECTKAPACMFCSLEASELPHGIQKHRNVQHGKDGDMLMSKYECDHCHMQSYSYTYLMEHKCLPYYLPHRCSCMTEEVFLGRTEFDAHFVHHYTNLAEGYHCNLCQQVIPRDKYMSHRGTHSLVNTFTKGRKIIIKDPKLLSAEENPPVLKEKPDEVVIRETLDALVKQVTASDDNEDTVDLVDSDDDDCVMIDSTNQRATPETEEENPNAAALRVPRVEAADNYGGGGQSSGIFDDDDDDDAIMDCSQENGPTVQPVIDDDGDDELSVVAEVTHPSGTLPSVIAAGTSRSKKKCPRCSEMFITNVALKKHLETSHRLDAGGVIEEDFGIPVEKLLNLCRICCHAFETQEQYQRHQAAHGPQKHNCVDCSAVAYNAQLLTLHRRAHDDRHLTFACAECHIAYRTDSQLYGHLEERHKVRLVYFCKNCELGSTNGPAISEHIRKRICSSTRAAHINETPESQLGVAPAAILNYIPQNVAQHKRALAANPAMAVVPSPCSHRSFIAATNAAVACRSCHCLTNIYSYVASEEAAGRSARTDYLIQSHAAPTPQRDILNLLRQPPIRMNAARFLNSRNQAYPIVSANTITTKVGRPMSYVRPMPTTQPLPGYVPPPPQPKRLSQANNGQSATVQIVERPLNLTALAGAMGVDVASAVPTGRHRVNLPKSGPSVVEGLIAAEPPAAPAQPTPSSSAGKYSAKILKDRVGGECGFCGKHLRNEGILRLHALHTNGHNAFCLLCHRSFPDEQTAVVHIFKHHDKQLGIEGKEKPVEFSLRCPFHGCDFHSTSMSALNELRRHLNKHTLTHTTDYCNQKFATAESRKRHDLEHTKMEELGLETNCCLLCGTTNMWTSRLAGFTTPISHTMVHGFYRYVMCRDCNVCFKRDADNSRFTRHFQDKHVTEMEGKPRCALCHTSFATMAEALEHGRQKHFVIGIKSREGAGADGSGITVTSGPQMRASLGIEPMYSESDPKDFD
ncbi:unnamed protein product, partial [Mesorhabditis spiculigera]